MLNIHSYKSNFLIKNLSMRILILAFACPLTLASLICHHGYSSKTLNPTHPRVSSIKDGCCPNNADGIPYSSTKKGCCCGTLFDVAVEKCCEQTCLIKELSKPCETTCDMTEVEHITDECTDSNNVGSTCTMGCPAEQVLIKDGEVVEDSTEIAECKSTGWFINIPPQMCCVAECPPLQEGIKVDYMIVLDKSSSIGDGNFDIVKDFMKTMIDIMPLDNDSGRMSMITYNTIVESVFSFDDSTSLDKDALKSKVDDVIYSGRGTHTYLGLEWMIDNELTVLGRAIRPGVKPVMLVVTDGRSYDKTRVRQRANQLHNELDVEVYCIGVGNQLHEDDIVDIASEPKADHLRMVDFFEDIEAVAKSWVSNLCENYVCE